MSIGQLADMASIQSVLPDDEQWFAVMTRSRHEKKAGTEIEKRGITTFVPTAREVHRWSDRRMVVEMPLFANYAFVKISMSPRHRLSVLQAPGVLRFVEFNDGPVPIPESEIEAIKILMTNNVPFSSCGFLNIGQRVRIRGGSLDGVEGVLVGRNGDRRLVISINLIQQSIAMVVEGYDVEPVR